MVGRGNAPHGLLGVVVAASPVRPPLSGGLRVERCLRRGRLSGLRSSGAQVLRLPAQNGPRRGRGGVGDGYGSAAETASGNSSNNKNGGIGPGAAPPAGSDPSALAARGEQGPGVLPVPRGETEGPGGGRSLARPFRGGAGIEPRAAGPRARTRGSRPAASPLPPAPSSRPGGRPRRRAGGVDWRCSDAWSRQTPTEGPAPRSRGLRTGHRLGRREGSPRAP